MTEQTALGQAIEKHWREHRPTMVKDLQKRKQLNQAVLEAQELTGDLLYELVSVKKMDYGAAWEVAMREWALLPQETSASKPGRPKSSPSRRRGRALKSSRSRRRRHRKTSGEEMCTASAKAVWVGAVGVAVQLASGLSYDLVAASWKITGSTGLYKLIWWRIGKRPSSRRFIPF